MKKLSSTQLAPLGLPILLAWTAACAAGDVPRPISETRDSAGIEVVNNDLSALDAVCALSHDPTLTIGRGRTGDEYDLYHVQGATRLSDGRIAVVNRGSDRVLRFYDDKGGFLRSSGPKGDGPGEFKLAHSIWRLPGDTIWVGNYAPWRFEVFAPDGSWIRTVRPQPSYLYSPSFVLVLDDGRSVMAKMELMDRAKPVYQLLHLTVMMHTPDGALLDTLMTVPYERVGPASKDPHNVVWIQPLFESSAVVAGHGQEFVVGNGSRPELALYEVSRKVRVTRLIRWTAGDRAVTSQRLAQERKRIADRNEGVVGEARKRMVEPLLSEDRPVADSLPAFTRAVVGRDGRIWVKPYPTLSNQNSSNWIGFDHNGHAECRLPVPENADVLEIGPHYMLVHDTDELGVEGVSMYALTNPSD